MKLLFVSLGCDKNLVDSEYMIGMLTSHGIELTDDETEADIIIVNSCCFIGDAKEESINTILQLAELKTEGQLKAMQKKKALIPFWKWQSRKKQAAVNHSLSPAA